MRACRSHTSLSAGNSRRQNSATVSAGGYFCFPSLSGGSLSGMTKRKKCEHGRLRYYCKDCGGSGICLHNRRRDYCKDCGGHEYHCRADCLREMRPQRYRARYPYVSWSGCLHDVTHYEVIYFCIIRIFDTFCGRGVSACVVRCHRATAYTYRVAYRSI